MIVSVKTSKTVSSKRKPSETAAQIYEQEIGSKESKKLKKADRKER